MTNTINIQTVVKGFLLLSFLVGAFFFTQAQADNNNVSANGFSGAHAALKADVLAKLENSTGVIVGTNGSLRVIGAKVTSVSGSDVNATASIGNSTLSFVVKTDSNTKVNGKTAMTSSLLGELEAGDKISFAGTITSSTSSSVTVDGDHVISQAFTTAAKADGKTSFRGEVKSVNTSDSSFTVELKNDVTAKVTVASGTVITIDGDASTLASLEVGDDVKIAGTTNTDGSVITASKVVADSDDDDDEDDDKKVSKKEDKENRKFWSRIFSWLKR